MPRVRQRWKIRNNIGRFNKRFYLQDQKSGIRKKNKKRTVISKSLHTVSIIHLYYRWTTLQRERDKKQLAWRKYAKVNLQASTTNQ